MNIKHKLLLWSMLLALSTGLHGQQKGLSSAFLVNKFDFFLPPNLSIPHSRYFQVMADQMHLTSDSQMKLEEEIEGHNGYLHYQYQQFHDGVPVFGGTYILHEKDGRVTHGTGRYAPRINTSVTPDLDEAAALLFAKNDMGAEQYSDKATNIRLVLIDPAFPEVSENVVLAYQVDLVATEPVEKHRYFVDAHHGEIVKDFPLILEHGVPATAKTRYYGEQKIVVDSIAPQKYILQDPTRGDGIFIYNESGNSFSNSGKYWNLANADLDEVALDAHYCTQTYYDMMLETFNWEGMDGHGKALKARVHTNSFGSVGAYWDGEATNYGDGNCHYGPLTTLEVVGHEFTHGMIEHTSKLVYVGEPGAINESLADMFGKILEYKTTPADLNWTLGHSFILNPDAKPFRQMDDPNSLDMPALYNGDYWKPDNNVHINSAIGNLWFTILVEGKDGINEAGTIYQVEGVGFDKAAQIVFLTNQAYLTESSDYNSFYQYSLAAAEELFGAGSEEVQDVREAWKAVGLPATNQGALDLSIIGGDESLQIFCTPGGYFPVRIPIVNRSGEAYLPSMGAKIVFESSALSSTTTIPLSVVIGPGETYVAVIDDVLPNATPGYTFVNIRFEFADADPNNNRMILGYYVPDQPGVDLYLSVTYDDLVCFADSITRSFHMYNKGCQTILKGTQLQFQILDPQEAVIWTKDYTMQNDLPAGRRFFVPFSTPVFQFPVTYLLVFEEDTYTEDNSFVNIQEKFYSPINAEYLNTFEENNGIDDHLLMYGNGAAIGTLFYQNSLHLRSSGIIEDVAQYDRCLDPLETFNQKYGNGMNRFIRTCVDFSEVEHPELSFDLTLFKNNETQASSYLYSSMLEAKWDGNEDGAQHFFDQPEGTVERKTVTLPPNFKGEITLSFYTEIGKYPFVDASLATDDVVLLDNLRFSTMVKTEEPKEQSFLKIFPNPAEFQVQIESGLTMQQIQILDIQGRSISTIHTESKLYQLPLTDLAKGIYIISVTQENGAQITQKLVVI
ncbi:MAG TPA: M4 family metallopeptidase [Saprospiraceae bacterium]|nr:M4 family metallopeptidase [Saprospiraceae bacterium]